MNVVICDASCVAYDPGEPDSACFDWPRKANQLASSKTLAKPNLRADCVVAFEQAWGRVEDVVGGGERPQVKPSLALESRSLAFQAELTSAHSRVTTRHRLHHYPENQSAAGAAPPDVQDGANQSPGSIHRYENAARGAIFRGGRVAEACATTARGDGRRRSAAAARAPTATRPAGSPRRRRAV